LVPKHEWAKSIEAWRSAVRVVAIGSEIKPLQLKRVEGHVVGEGSSGKELLVGRLGLLVEATVDRGVVTPPHTHNHESICYLVKGKVRVTIGDDTWLLGPGDAFLHPEGVLHTTEVLEDSTWIEFKSPPERTWESS
jgi:quercetin dioxygenase-like cupin family protein